MLTPAEERGLSGLSLASRVRNSMFKIPDAELGDLLQRIRAEAMRRHVVYLRDGGTAAINIMACPLTVLPDQLAYIHSVTLKIQNALKRLVELYMQMSVLAARRLAERGVRFALAYVSDYGEWDSHMELQKYHARSCARVDKPIAGLLKDLKSRGMWDDTVVVFCTEFGRTPGVEVRDAYKEFTGRDHHPHGFTVWFAGAGIKRGFVHARTDELGFHAVESPHYVTDMHATLLHLLGIDPHQLKIPGRKRLEIDYGKPMHEILT